ncbi:MAG: lactate utilization protein [Truepera sp.]|nr:lactate utilization protein [Truepera sp.]
MNRDAFIGRVRQALGRAPGDPVAAPPQPYIPEVPVSADSGELVARFGAEFERVGGQLHRAESVEEAREILDRLLREHQLASVLTTGEPLVQVVTEPLALKEAEDPADADAGITGAVCGVAATGSLVLSSGVGRRPSLMPLVHLVVLESSAIVADLHTALERFGGDLPSGLVQATGPSRTADIEQTLTTGVHGPGSVQLILVG